MRAASIIVGAAVTAIAAGCNAPADNYQIATVFDPCEPVVIVPEKGTTNAERDGAVAGVAMWNELANAHYVVDGEPTTEDADAVANAPRIPLHFDPAGGNFHGFYDDKRAIIFVNTDLSGEKLAITIAHEVGHTAGLLHVDKAARKSVMNGGNLVVTPTRDDVDAVAAIWGACPSAAELNAEKNGASP